MTGNSFSQLVQIRVEGLEPSLLSELDFKSSASADSATPSKSILIDLNLIETLGIEPRLALTPGAAEGSGTFSQNSSQPPGRLRAPGITLGEVPGSN